MLIGGKKSLPALPDPGFLAGNLLTQPFAFDNAAWDTPSAVIVTANAVDDLEATKTADLISANNGASASHHVSDTGLTTSAIQYTARVRAKHAGNGYISIIVGSTAAYAAFASVTFNILSGQVVGNRGVTYVPISQRIVPLVNGWYLCEFQIITAANSTHRFDIRTTISANDGFSFTGNNVDGAYLWGAEFAPSA